MIEVASKNQRSNKDRRQNHIPFYKLFLIKGKRRRIQRVEDCKQITVLDQYHPNLLIFVLITLSLSLLDATLTLTLLNKGAEELNPVMRYYINMGPEIFVIAKYGLTALALLIMVLLNPIISVRHRTVSSLMFPFSALVFGAVILWELYLLAM